MVEPEVALVFSPETWVEELHRYLADHGGARVRQIVMEPSLALDEQYDTLVCERIHVRGVLVRLCLLEGTLPFAPCRSSFPDNGVVAHFLILR